MHTESHLVKDTTHHREKKRKHFRIEKRIEYLNKKDSSTLNTHLYNDRTRTLKWPIYIGLLKI